MRVIRDPTELNMVAVFGVEFGLEATKAMLNFYRPDELGSFNEWYGKEINDRASWLTKLQVTGMPDE